MGLTRIYDPAVDKSSIGAVKVRDDDLAIAAERDRAMDSGDTGVVQPEAVSSHPAQVQRSAPSDKVEAALPSIVRQQYEALTGSSLRVQAGSTSDCRWRARSTGATRLAGASVER